MDLFLGHIIKQRQVTPKQFKLHWSDFLTHAFICGSTGSGKTVLAKLLIEEMAKAGVPCVLVDLKGDISSLAIPVTSFTPEELEPWVDAVVGPERFKKAREISGMYSKELSVSNLSQKDVKDFRNSIKVNIFTPRSKKGKRVSISLMVSAPENIDTLMKNDEYTVLNMIQTYAHGIIRRLYPGEEIENRFLERCFLEEIIKYLWVHHIPCDGVAGIKQLIQNVLKPSFTTIGVLKVDMFISADARLELSRRLNTLLVGAERLWYEGQTIDSIIKNAVVKRKDHSNITIFNLSELDDFEDRSLIVSQVAYSIYNWMRRNVNSFEPQLLFFIDEIGGSGNKAFFPEEPYFSVSKPAINLLVRQGRAFGISTVLATQNPGDIDYRGLTNCQTWFIGKLMTKQDREKIIQGLSTFSYMLEQVDDFIKTADSGEFIVKTKDSSIVNFKERWLLSFHKVVTPDELSEIETTLAEKGISEHFSQFIAKKDYSGAESFIVEKEASGQVLHHYRAQIELFKGKYKEALIYAKSAVNENPADYQLWETLTQIYLKLKDYKSADEALNKAVELNPSNDELFRLKAHVSRVLGNYEDVIHQADQAVSVNPQNAEAFYERAFARYMTGEYENAREDADNAIRLFGETHTDSNVLAGNILIKQEQYLDGMDYFIRAISADDNDYRAYLGAGICQTMLKDFSNAEGFLKKSLELKSEDADTNFYLGMVSEGQDDVDAACDYYRTAFTADSGYEEAYIRCALIYENLEQYSEAEKVMNVALTAAKSATVYLILGRLNRVQGNTEEAEKMLRMAIEADPENEEAYTILAAILADSGQVDNACEIFKKVIELNTHNTDALLYLGMNSYEKGNFEESLECFKKYIEVDRENSQVWFKRAEIHKMKNEHTQGIICYKEAARIEPQNVLCFVRIAEILSVQKKYDEALDYLDRGEKSVPDSPEPWKARAEIYRTLDEDEKSEFCADKARELSAG